ncbi:Glucosyl-3-phosphoglycerate phosphatase [Agrobacterium sp. DSM 25558]|uniref:histidine phosphatase family protein n=1 Tax=Agrobacterium sp. DSM 25558 TaxID=1907665 RepID=UPI0009724613|nr:histidine phosphatase family protein [Agrobacterium sp. DSM 25558]SCX12761.1 Glucosyl-3-phosphoglycerate phosphatase [Agrobacterium sp. DSM 25558]
MLVYVIRHGQTDWNAIRRLQGQKDIPLNDFGRSQATENGKILSRILGPTLNDFDYIASPLGRTRETMELLRGAMGLEPTAYRTDERLVEISFGDWEGQTLPELKMTEPEKVKARKATKWDFIPPGHDAESYEILSWRIGAWLASVDRPTVCVCHGGVIRSMFRLVSGVDKDVAAEIAIPQDRILRVETEKGTVEWIDPSA